MVKTTETNGHRARAECYKIYGKIHAYGGTRDIRGKEDSGAYSQHIMIQDHGPTPSSPGLRPDVCIDTLAEVRLWRFMDTLFAAPAPIRALGDIRDPCRPIGIELVVAARGRLADEDILGSPPPPLRDVPCGVPEARFLSHSSVSARGQPSMK